MTNWGEWTGTPPLPEPEIPVTRETCEIRSRITKLGEHWDAPAITYRTHPKTPAQGIARLAAWARPHDTKPWIYAAITFHTMCEVQPGMPHAHTYTEPRWRTLWIIYDPALIQPAEHDDPAPTGASNSAKH